MKSSKATYLLRAGSALVCSVSAVLAGCGGGGIDEASSSLTSVAATAATPEVTALGASRGSSSGGAGGKHDESRCVRFEFTALASLGGSLSSANAINDAGAVVGYSNLPGDLVSRAVLWERGRLIDLGTLGGKSAYASDINDSGMIVGTSSTADGSSHATLWKNGKAIDLGTAGGTSSRANSINDLGQIVGDTHLGTTHDIVVLWNSSKAPGSQLPVVGGEWISSTSADINDKGVIAGMSGSRFYDDQQATVWDKKHQPSLLPGIQASFAYGINNRGTIVGVSRANPTSVGEATVWDRNGATILKGLYQNALGRYDGFATAINDAGVIVGSSATTANGDAHAVLWRGTQPIDLNDLLDANDVGSGWLLTSASGINNGNSIIGTAYNSMTQRTQGFVLRPSIERSRNGGSWDSKRSGRLCDSDL